jgi:hypothetical protein
MYINTHTHIDIYMQICKFAYMFMYVCIYVCMYIYIYTYIYIYIYVTDHGHFKSVIAEDDFLSAHACKHPTWVKTVQDVEDFTTEQCQGVHANVCVCVCA